MAIRQRDYILRQIEQLAQALGTILGLRQAGKHEEALQLIRETVGALLGPMVELVDGVDSASAAMLLGSRDKLLAYATLVAQEGAVHQDRGDARRAHNSYRRALELYLEAMRMSSTVDERTREDIQSLRALIDEGRLATRYREALARL